MTYSVLPLGRQIVKLGLYLIAILSVFSAWGYNTSTVLAGLGVGGLAVALAAQKTLENLFGGVSVIGDRPVLVGDICRFGDRTGTVMHIGLRSDAYPHGRPHGHQHPQRPVFGDDAGEHLGARQDSVSSDAEAAPRDYCRADLEGARLAS